MSTSKKHKLDPIEKEGVKEQKIDVQELHVDAKTVNNGEPEQITIRLEDIGKADTRKLSMKANRYIKSILSEWEDKADTESEKVLLKDTKKSLFPILVKMRKNTVDSNQLISILTIFYHLQRKEYLRANESYMKLSIGNTAWPIGVMNVSIHSRSSQVKTHEGGANIMIDEVTRKWITAVKRLISFRERQST